MNLGHARNVVQGQTNKYYTIMNLLQINDLIRSCELTNNFDLANFYRLKRVQLIATIKNEIAVQLSKM